MEKSGKVSIITPTYNCGRFIAESIRSVQAQTYTDWEMIIVDDCSTDDTKDVVEQFADDKRIKYHCLDQNSGAAVARNTALRIAKGRWIAFLDSDDLWMPKKLEKQIQFMVERGYSFSYHNYDEIDESGNPLGKRLSGPKHISRLRMISYCWLGCLTAMYDANKVGLIQTINIKKNNDYAMWLKVSKKASCHLLPVVLAHYRKRVGSISNTNYVSLIKWHFRLFKDAESYSTVSAALCTINNLFWGLFKKLFYSSFEK